MANRRELLRQITGCLGGAGLWLTACTPRPADRLQVPKTMQLTSNAFVPNATMPPQYTCKGEDISPALSWDEPPTGTQSFALIVDDPDAPGKTFTHWVLYDLPSDLRQLPENLPPDPILLTGGVQGKNDFDRYGYGGPCPPSGTHRYVFQLYALDTLLDLAPGMSKTEVIAAMRGHILAGAELVGQYGK